MRVLIINVSENLLDIAKSLFGEFYFAKNINGIFHLIVSKQGSERELLHFHLPNDKLAGFLLMHIAYLASFFKIAKQVNLIILSQIADYPLLLLFFGKIMNKRIIDFIGGSRIFLSQVVLHTKTSLLRRIASIYGIVSLKFACHIADKIVLISDSLISDKSFNKFSHKVCIAWNFPSEKFYNKFNVKRKYDERDLVIGYIGKFTLAKGIYNFALAMKNVLKDVPEIKVIFVGDYQNSEPLHLGLKIKRIFEGCNNVVFTGQVSHEKVADYLNEMRLLVLPSYSEGFPHVVLESMACGTPVAASPVGAIPEILDKGRYGYILSSRQPKLLANEIVKILSSPRNSKLSEEISEYVRRTYTYERAVEGWKLVIKEVHSKR